jgi:hypothetical protein
MTNRKNYNSIVFLTTLSVYLGLVLVGAPPVLAQAALTQKIEIKNEAEIKDDLDKKPDDDLFAQTLVELIKNLSTLSNNKVFDWEAKSTFTIEDLGFCESDNTSAYSGSGSINRRVDRILSEASLEIGRKLLTKKWKAGLGEFYVSYPEGVTFKFSIENKNFNLDTEINTKSPDSAKAFGALIDAYLSQNNSSAETTSQKIIAENTKSKVDDTKILLSTHLPRASIDELLAQKVAQ